MKPAPQGIYFAKRKNYGRVIILAYKLDLKIRITITELIFEIQGIKKESLQKRLKILSDAFDRLKRACPQYNLSEL